MVTHFCSLWFAVANAESQDASDEAIALLRKKTPAKFVDYVEQTWLPYASKFVAVTAPAVMPRHSVEPRGARVVQCAASNVDRLGPGAIPGL